jgi:hypothetical protein
MNNQMANEFVESVIEEYWHTEELGQAIPDLFFTLLRQGPAVGLRSEVKWSELQGSGDVWIGPPSGGK